VSISAGGPRTTSNPAGGQDIDDQWALGYISIFHVQPILEAFDDDGSGFVSVNEANELTASRPPTWRCVSLDRIDCKLHTYMMLIWFPLVSPIG